MPNSFRLTEPRLAGPRSPEPGSAGLPLLEPGLIEPKFNEARLAGPRYWARKEHGKKADTLAPILGRMLASHNCNL